VKSTRPTSQNLWLKIQMLDICPSADEAHWIRVLATDLGREHVNAWSR